MSATNRGSSRDPKDFYPTCLSAFEPLLSVLPMDSVFWEPCAGDGRLIRSLRASGRNADGRDLYPPDVSFLSIDGLGYDPTPVDYLKDFTPRDFVITNPS